MKPLRVLLVVKDAAASYAREEKVSGLFSHEVPEFTWQHIVLGRGFAVDTRKWAGRFDLVFHLDGGNWGTYTGPLPVVYHAIDSTLGEAEYLARLEQAAGADLVLVDHDRLERFTPCGRPVVRFPYCVNDRVMRDHGEKRADVGWHANVGGVGGKERRRVLAAVREHCHARGYSLAESTHPHPRAYAEALSHARVVIVWPRVQGNRPHRVFDAMACRSAVLSGPLPAVPEDGRRPGWNIEEVGGCNALRDRLDDLLTGDCWRGVADAGHALVTERHTWATRARELRSLLAERFAGRLG